MSTDNKSGEREAVGYITRFGSFITPSEMSDAFMDYAMPAPLFSLSQLEAVERERDEALDHDWVARSAYEIAISEAYGFRSRATTAEAQVTSLQQQVAELKGALEPFAEAAENIEDYVRDTDHMWESAAAMGLNAADFRRARSTLTREATNE